MKTTMVPAQVTTVEDKIAGNLSLLQLIMLCAPIFIGGGIYALFPPILKLNLFKVSLCIFIVISFGILAIRWRGKLLINWIVVIGRYRLRPRYYVFDKNDLYLRESVQAAKKSQLEPVKEEVKPHQPLIPMLPVPKLVSIESLINDPQANFHLSVGKKGSLDVHITEIK